MQVVLHGKYITITGEQSLQRPFNSASVVKTTDGVQLLWQPLDTVNIYLASITTNLDGTALTYETVDDMYNDYITKQQAL